MRNGGRGRSTRSLGSTSTAQTPRCKGAKRPTRIDFPSVRLFEQQNLYDDREETMQLDRRQLALTLLALGLMTAPLAFAGADEDAVLKNLETFRAAQAAGNADAIAPL